MGRTRFSSGEVMSETAAVILAAGLGRRMQSSIPKVLHRVAGRPMVQYVIQAAREAGVERIVVVLGHGADAVRQALDGDCESVVQPEPAGTADALARAAPILTASPDCRQVLVAYGDCPLLTGDLFRSVIEAQRQAGAAIALVSSIVEDPRGYGRIVRDPDGGVRAIVEEAAATEAERAIREVNAGVYCFDAAWLWERLPSVPRSTSGEYYLTDLVGLAAQDGRRVCAVTAPLEITAGVNDRKQLAMAEAVIRDRVRQRLLEAGVTLVDPATVYVDATVRIAPDTILYPGTLIEGNTVIGPGCRIGPYSRIVDSWLGSSVTVDMSVIEGARVGDGTRIGPFSHLRPGAEIGPRVELGNYAEIKNARIGADTRIHHVSYIGDAEIGERVNVGAGTITVNFDSESGTKHRTVVQDGASLGSDSMLVAPVTIGRDALTGAGAVVTRDVEPGMVVVGVPARPLRRRRQSAG